MIKKATRDLLSKTGIYAISHRSMPRGIDWLRDIQRIIAPDTAESVFDVGANVGQTVLKIRQVFPSARIFAFEPISSTFAALQKNTQGLPNVRISRLALADSLSKGFMVSEDNSELSRFVGGAGDATAQNAAIQEVEITTVDHFCDQNRIERINILKIDTEGADLNVLKGASKMLQSGNVDFVYAETCFDVTDKIHSYFPAVQSFLAGCGMTFNGLYEQMHLNRGRHFLYCNALFISARMRNQNGQA